MKNYTDLDTFLADLPAIVEELQDKLAGRSVLLKLETGLRSVFLQLRDGRLTVLDNCADAPAATVSAREDVLLSMLAGKMNPLAALLTGKVRISGDKGAMMALVNLLKD